GGRPGPPARAQVAERLPARQAVLPARPVLRTAVGAVADGSGDRRPGRAGADAAVPGRRARGDRRPRLPQREPGEEGRMTTERALLAAIREDPEDDAARLVYADWLEEQGQADRAELIRVKVRARRADGDEWQQLRE